ncbi:MAG TPA: carotenoid biosynthesis protein [Candidatus Sulfotelmatobacter sp.]|nr:carotenoid biosynthesis protein [Candidatus Sulfotelmatobacter sp.]
MTDLLALLWGTVCLRPYVFAFLAVHGWSAVRGLGARRAVALTGIVWGVAFAAEWTSTRVGFPFGRYAYTEATRGQELFLGNIPFADSLSFTFLAWASYALALLLTRPREGTGAPSIVRRGAPGTLGLAVACFVLIDVIIDPLAVRGDRWFLGKIFEYPDGGAYFGVPLSNFVGWAVVGALGFALYARLDRRWEARGRPLPTRAGVALPWGGALWFAVAAFILLITFALGEVALGFVGLTIAGMLAGLLAARRAETLPGRAARAWQRETSNP